MTYSFCHHLKSRESRTTSLRMEGPNITFCFMRFMEILEVSHSGKINFSKSLIHFSHETILDQIVGQRSFLTLVSKTRPPIDLVILTTLLPPVTISSRRKIVCT